MIDFILYAFSYTDLTNDLIDGKYIYVPAQDNYRACPEYMRKLYSEGLIDDDYFTQDSTKLSYMT